MLTEALDIIRALHSGGQVTWAGHHFAGIAVEPRPELVSTWDAVCAGHSQPANRKIGQILICWGSDEQRSVERVHELFRWFGGGWPVNCELPTPVAVNAASQFVTPDDVASSIACPATRGQGLTQPIGCHIV